MNLAAVVSLLDEDTKEALAEWCEAELETRSSDPVFAARGRSLRDRYAGEPVDDPALWLVTTLISSAYMRSYEWQAHLDTHGPSPAADAAHAAIVRCIWQELAVLSGASEGAAQVVGTLAQTWEPVSGDVTQEMWSELVATAESLTM